MGATVRYVNSSLVILLGGRGNFILGERVCNANSMPHCTWGRLCHGGNLITPTTESFT